MTASSEAAVRTSYRFEICQDYETRFAWSLHTMVGLPAELTPPDERSTP